MILNVAKAKDGTNVDVPDDREEVEDGYGLSDEESDDAMLSESVSVPSPPSRPVKRKA